MTARATLDRFVAELAVTLCAQLDWDETEVYVGASFELAALPTAADVERAYTATGFDCRLVQQGRNVQEFSGRRGAEKLRCVLLKAQTYNGRRLNGDELKLEWRSRERPQLSSRDMTWQGRRWPALFDDANLYFESKTLLIIQGRIPATGFATCLAQYQEWAAESGLGGYGSHEPDLDGDAGFADRDFVVTIENRAPYVTLTVRRRERGETPET